MLQRMRELTVQAGNDTNKLEDRKAIQAEIKQLSSEINDISAKTEFNKQKLLDGSFKNKSLQVGANEGQIMGISIESMSGENLGLGEIKSAAQTGVKSKFISGLAFTTIYSEHKFEVTVNGETKEISMSGANGDNTILDAIRKIQDAFGEDVSVSRNLFNQVIIEATEKKAGAVSVKVTKSIVGNPGFGANTGNPLIGRSTPGKDEWAEEEFILGISVKDAASVETTLGKIDKAISTVSKQRSSLGAVQNRLEHTIKNLNNAAENTQAAEARIRDTDMAKEMSTFTKNNVLSQAAQAMISQANQIPNQALQLLR